MLKKSEKTGIYKDLICQDINLFLKKHNNKYQLISAIELLGYLPEIMNCFTGVFNCLIKKGYFVFSVETTDTDDDNFASSLSCSPQGHLCLLLKNHIVGNYSGRLDFCLKNKR